MTRSNGQGDHASAVKKCRTADGLVGWWAGRHCRAPRIEAFYRSSLPRAPSVSNGQLGDIDDEGVYRDELFEEAQSVNDVEQGVLRLVLDQQRVKKTLLSGRHLWSFVDAAVLDATSHVSRASAGQLDASLRQSFRFAPLHRCATSRSSD